MSGKIRVDVTGWAMQVGRPLKKSEFRRIVGPAGKLVVRELKTAVRAGRAPRGEQLTQPKTERYRKQKRGKKPLIGDDKLLIKNVVAKFLKGSPTDMSIFPSGPRPSNKFNNAGTMGAYQIQTGIQVIDMTTDTMNKAEELIADQMEEEILAYLDNRKPRLMHRVPDDDSSIGGVGKSLQRAKATVLKSLNAPNVPKNIQSYTRKAGKGK